MSKKKKPSNFLNDFEEEEEDECRRKTWNGYYPRRTKTRREKEISELRKEKQRTKWLED